METLALFVENARLIEWGGLLLIAALVFAETGLLLGLVIPGGETLIFTAGLLVSTQALQLPVTALIPLLITAGMLGDICGYYIGRKYGRRLYQKKDRWFFRKEYLFMAEDYLKRHKTSALIMGKFLPVVRPFTPVMTGISQLPFAQFLALTSVSATLYMATFALAGYFLGKQFPGIQQYLGWILPASVMVLLLPVILQVRKNRRRQRSGDHQA